MSDNLPRVTRTYLNHHLDSSRWDAFTPRKNDVVVTTSYKCGTTFTQQILYNLLLRNTYEDEVFPSISAVSPWIDARFMPLDKPALKELLQSYEHRRFLKSHLPLDGLPYYPQVKYLIVGRDPRDVFMSLVNHYGAYTDFFYGLLNHDGEAPMPRFDGDIPAMFRNWISRGWFDWEREGYPFWSNMHHTQSYWDYRHLPNLMFVHYADLLANLPAMVRKIADFLEHPVTDKSIAEIARAVSFERIKQQAVIESSRPSDVPEAFEGGQATFINKGTNGRWIDVLSDEDLALYRETRDTVLSPDCAAWLEGGEQSRS